MNLLILLCVLCVTFTGLCEGFGVLVDDLLNAPVGGKVLFTTKLMPQDPPVTFNTVIWSLDTSIIITFTADVNKTTPGYENRITLFISTGSLELRNLTLNDSGDYTVTIITSDGSAQSGNTRLMIYDGPDGVQIIGPREINVKDTLTLICSAESTPSATYTWSRNTTEILSDSAEFTKPVAEFSDSGSYTCTATNNVTGRRSTAVHALSVTVKRPPSCSSGCINGIKFACCLVVGLCAGGWYFVSRRRKQSKNLSHGDTRTGSTGAGIQNSVASSRNQDVTYENIDSLRNQDGGTVQLELERISSS